MILVLGGLASGKRTYVRSLGYCDADFDNAAAGGGLASDGRPGCGASAEEAMRIAAVQDAELPVLANAQELVRAGDVDVVQLAAGIAQSRQVVTCVDVGCGIVPADAGERAWRERAGALACNLAARAHAVVRMTCGIPVALKGELSQPATIRLVIMRHGATDLNEQRRYVGSTDAPLSPVGEQQAVAAGVRPDVRRVYVSPLQRARRTAQLCFPNAQQVVVDGLQEMDFGDFEGRSAADMEHDAAYRSWVDGMCAGRCPGGEDRAALTRRVTAAIERVIDDAQHEGEKQAIVVAHGGTVMAAMSALCHDSRDYFEWHVGNCQGYVADAVRVHGEIALQAPVRFDNLRFNLGDQSTF